MDRERFRRVAEIFERAFDRGIGLYSAWQRPADADRYQSRLPG